jgi:hypothetical protein
MTHPFGKSIFIVRCARRAGNDGLSENYHEARDQPCRSDRFSLFVVAGQLGPAMLVYMEAGSCPLLRTPAFVPCCPGVPGWWLLADNVTRPVQIGKEKRQGQNDPAAGS